MAKAKKTAAPVAAVKANVVEAKTVDKKPVANKATGKKSSVYVQFGGLEVDVEQVTKAAKDAWGGKKSDIVSFDLYIKPEDNAAYYVVNGTDQGSISLS